MTHLIVFPHESLQESMLFTDLIHASPFHRIHHPYIIAPPLLRMYLCFTGVAHASWLPRCCASVFASPLLRMHLCSTAYVCIIIITSSLWCMSICCQAYIVILLVSTIYKECHVSVRRNNHFTAVKRGSLASHTHESPESINDNFTYIWQFFRFNSQIKLPLRHFFF